MTRKLVPVLAPVLALLLLAGCGGRPAAAPADPGHPTSLAPASSGPAGPSSGPTDPPGAADPYVHLAELLHRRGVQVWFEADLVKAWLAGPTAFRQLVARLGTLSHVPGVVGFKIADELGYHDGITSPARATAFLTAARTALHRAAPGAQLLIDMVVPELGCLPWLDASGRTCAAQARATSPATSVAAVTGYLRAGLVDRLDLSTGLLDPSAYAARGLTIDAAQRAAWTEVDRLGWGSLTTLQARKALAAPGGYQGSAAQASADVRLYVGIPAAAGAGSVDIWTWRQPYDGATVSLLAPSLAPNPLWQALARLRGGPTGLLTHMTPSQMPTAAAPFAHECDLVARVFSGVFVAAGT